ncbi:MAG TPA: GAP family protein [Thermomicrobiales bacterium]|nr:GAP family protein [Thermomicrobiales bacterium]
MAEVWVELGLVALAAMVSPTTLAFSIFALMLGDRPLRTGFWFYVGALGITLIIGVAGAFIIGDVAASHSSNPKTWVAVVDIMAGVLVLGYVVHALRRPRDPERMASMMERMSKLASSPVIAIVGAGAILANPGGFIPLALKDISQLNPDTGQYIVAWLFFSLISLLPMAIALLMLILAREHAMRILGAARAWLERHGRTVAAVILVLLAAVLLRNGIAGLA